MEHTPVITILLNSKHHLKPFKFWILYRNFGWLQNQHIFLLFFPLFCLFSLKNFSFFFYKSLQKTIVFVLCFKSIENSMAKSFNFLFYCCFVAAFCNKMYCDCECVFIQLKEREKKYQLSFVWVHEKNEEENVWSNKHYKIRPFDWKTHDFSNQGHAIMSINFLFIYLFFVYLLRVTITLDLNNCRDTFFLAFIFMLLWNVHFYFKQIKCERFRSTFDTIFDWEFVWFGLILLWILQRSCLITPSELLCDLWWKIE